MADYSITLLKQHQTMLAASGITPEHARARGYVSVDTKKRLETAGITPAGRNVPGLLIPQLRVDGSTWGYQYRPDVPRLRDGKPVKYETPTGQRNGIDVPPGVASQLGDPTVPLWVTEGVKKADAGALAGLCVVALPGVWSWRGSNERGGKVAVPDWHDIALNGRRVVLAFDSDVTRKPAVRSALDALAGYLSSKGAAVEFCHLPDAGDGKGGLDDYLVTGGTVRDLLGLVRPQSPEMVPDRVETVQPAQTPVLSVQMSVSTTATINQVHASFTRWLGDEYDLDALDVVLAAAAVERLDGDPVWLLMLSGSGMTKTETVQALKGAGAYVTSTITSEGALLSATSKRETSKDATGGLLRKMGSRGVLVVKDVTSILSMNKDMRGQVLAALREVYDGRWERNVGTDGGKTLTWEGRLVVIGAVTSEYDRHHAVISAMGDRFALVRVDSGLGRMTSGRQALRNVGSEIEMRAELSEVVGRLLNRADGQGVRLGDDTAEALLSVANLVTLARTAVEKDYKGQVLEAHAPEAPTRFTKMLGQVVRGGLSLGMDLDHCRRLAFRVAHDSLNPLRLECLLDVAGNPYSRTLEVAKRMQKPRQTVDRYLQELHILGLLYVDEVDDGKGWRYSLSQQVDDYAVAMLNMQPGKVSTRELENKEGKSEPVRTATDFSGRTSEQPHPEPVEPEKPDEPVPERGVPGTGVEVAQGEEVPLNWLNRHQPPPPSSPSPDDCTDCGKPLTTVVQREHRRCNRCYVCDQATAPRSA